MKTENREPFRTWDGGILLGIVLLVGSLATILLDSAFSRAPELKPTLSYAVVPVSIGLVVAIYGAVFRKDFGFIAPKRTVGVAPLLLSPLAGVGLLAFLMIFNYLAVYAATAVGLEMSVTVPSLDSPSEWALAVLCVCIMPAIAEETLFRGILLSSSRNGGTATAVFFSATAFALFHFNLAQFVYPLLYGGMLAITACRTGNIVYGAIMHFVNNLVTLVLTKTGAVAFLDVFSWANVGILFAICLSGFGVFTVAFSLMTKFSDETEYVKIKESTMTKAEKIGLWATLGGLFALWLAMVIYNVVK